MVDFSEQPEVVPVVAWMITEGEEVAAVEARVALALGQLKVAAQAFQGTLGQVLAARAFGEAAGVVVDLQRRIELGAVAAFHHQPGFLEVVIAVAGLGAAGFQAYPEGAHHFALGNHAAVLLVGQGRELGKHRLVVAEHQHVSIFAVLEVKADAFLFAQALDEVQVGFVVLHTVLALGIDSRAELELVGVGLDAVLLQHLGDDLHHRQVLEDALVEAVRQVGQLRAQGDAVTGQALTGVALLDAIDSAMHAFAGRAVGQVAGLVDQGIEVQVGRLADQFDVETVGFVEGFAAGEFEHLQVVGAAFDSQAEMGLVG
jgi:hypothetical protein